VEGRAVIDPTKPPPGWDDPQQMPELDPLLAFYCCRIPYRVVGSREVHAIRRAHALDRAMAQPYVDEAVGKIVAWMRRDDTDADWRTANAIEKGEWE